MDPKEAPIENEICPNCKREVPQQNYLMHVAHCQRNMVVCRVCGEAVPRSIIKEHHVKLHTLVECKDCRYKVQSSVLEHHRKNSCGRRQVVCPYCELELPYCDMDNHEDYCGSRTERCDECGELVMFKYKKIHLDSNHGFLKLDDEPGPVPSWDASRQQTSQRNTRVMSAQENRHTERNTNTMPVQNRTNYKPQFSDNNLPPSPPRGSSDPREVPQREPITPYDASEDLRAKVKLMRHNLNDIKQSYLMKEERRDQDEARNLNLREYDMTLAQTRKTEKFTTNLVPYEKNKSHKINAAALDENQKNYFNYLGARESPPKTFVPLSNVNTQKPNKMTDVGTEKLDKISPKANLGAKPRKYVQISEPKLKEPNKGVETRRRIQKTEFNNAMNQNRMELARKEAVFTPEFEQAEFVKDRAVFPQQRMRHSSQEKEPIEGACFVETPRTGAMPKKSHVGTVPKKGGKHKSTNTHRRASPPKMAPLEAVEEVILPCEFCEKMVPASELVQHETGCRPDLAQINVPENIQNSPTNDMSEGFESQRRSNSPEVKLPCEFCFTLYPASRLLSHQQMCGV